MEEGKRQKVQTNILDSILTVAEYIEMKVQGFSDGEVAKKLYVSEHTLQRWKAKNHIKRYHVNVRRYAVIEYLLNKGYSMYRVAVYLKLSVSQCKAIRSSFSRQKDLPYAG